MAILAIGRPVLTNVCSSVSAKFVPEASRRSYELDQLAAYREGNEEAPCFAVRSCAPGPWSPGRPSPDHSGRGPRAPPRHAQAAPTARSAHPTPTGSRCRRGSPAGSSRAPDTGSAGCCGTRLRTAVRASPTATAGSTCPTRRSRCRRRVGHQVRPRRDGPRRLRILSGTNLNCAGGAPPGTPGCRARRSSAAGSSNVTPTVRAPRCRAWPWAGSSTRPRPATPTGRSSTSPRTSRTAASTGSCRPTGAT